MTDNKKILARNAEIIERHNKAVEDVKAAVKALPPPGFRPVPYVEPPPTRRPGTAERVVNYLFAVALGVLGGVLLAKWVVS
jgi:hypothetical protein